MPVAEGWERSGGGWVGGGRGSEASLTAGSRLDSHEIRGLCFLYAQFINYPLL